MSIVKSPSSNLKLALTPSSTHPQHHLYHHLLPCNESHNHRQSQIERFLAKTLSPRLFSLHNIQLVSLGLTIYDAHTNLLARGPASTNLHARSPALRTSPLVVLLYGPARL
ncbi:hypothetical protein DEO72_LG2g3830 [Vigna unguiculata]|uniref:Uncharacterized protein n=1 Tax=Vigna unguiculata TaxID=3917 RepID=A0A4D6L4T0_VIGUN|nr:hypothetical protein DEO72_LG2g3830 [Vigna unguiculata]